MQRAGLQLHILSRFPEMHRAYQALVQDLTRPASGTTTEKGAQRRMALHWEQPPLRIDLGALHDHDQRQYVLLMEAALQQYLD